MCSRGNSLPYLPRTNSVKVGKSILFWTHPCFLVIDILCTCRLFTERLQDNEVLVIEGFERYSDYAGYASTFKFVGDHKAKPLSNNRSRIPSTLVAMDALHFHSAPNQFRQEHIDRELNKAFIGFFNENQG